MPSGCGHIFKIKVLSFLSKVLQFVGQLTLVIASTVLGAEVRKAAVPLYPWLWLGKLFEAHL